MNIYIEDVLYLTKKVQGRIFPYHHESFDADYLYIAFLSKGREFILQIYQQQYDWFPSRIDHHDSKKQQCPYCGATLFSGTCEVLNNHLDTLHKQVMNHPKVRLKKLFF